MGVLSGIRVVDFTRVVAGPYCTMLLGDLGAEILKVEQPGLGDDTRSWGPPFVAGESAYFLAINRNKKSVCLDLRRAHDLHLAHELVRASDVVVENFRSGIMERFGLGYADWSQRHPGLIYCSISGYGRTGPYKDRAGYDVIVSAMGGLMGITGTPGEPPVKTGVALTDVATGLYAFSSILAALYHRQQCGLGQRIDVSLLSAELATLINAASNYLVAGEVPQPQGSAHGSIVPYQVLRAADGYLMLGAANDRLFQRLCQALDHPEWAADARFLTNADRVRNRATLIGWIEAILQSGTVAAWEARLAQAGIAVAPVNRMDQVFRDPQVVHSQQVVRIAHPSAGEIKLVGPAVSFSLTPALVTSAPPRLGEHTEEVVGALAMARENGATFSSSEDQPDISLELGSHRVLEPPGTLPQEAWKLDNTSVAYPGETLVRVRKLHIDSASFTQIAGACERDPRRMSEHILSIVAQRGKMHNPVTASGGVLLGTIEQLDADLARRYQLSVGDEVVSLTSLSWLPLSLRRISAIRLDRCEVEVEGQAIFFRGNPLARLPGDLAEPLVVAALDVAGAPARASELVRAGQRIIVSVLGAGGTAGLLTLCALRQKVGLSATIIAIEYSERALQDVRRLGVADVLVRADATRPLEALEAVRGACSGRNYLADLTINVVNVPHTEFATILLTKPDGRVLFFSMATSFATAALGAEGMARQVEMHIGNGYMPDRGALALRQLRDNSELRALFTQRFGA